MIHNHDRHQSLALSQMSHMLQRKESDLTATTDIGPLHFAFQCKRLPIVQHLLKQGLCVHYEATQNKSPIFSASERSQFTVEYFIRNGNAIIQSSTIIRTETFERQRYFKKQNKCVHISQLPSI